MSGLVGLVMIVVAMFAYDDTTAFPGVAVLLPCIGTALVIVSSTLGLSTAGKALSFNVPAQLGKISYSFFTTGQSWLC